MSKKYLSKISLGSGNDSSKINDVLKASPNKVLTGMKSFGAESSKKTKGLFDNLDGWLFGENSQSSSSSSGNAVEDVVILGDETGEHERRAMKQTKIRAKRRFAPFSFV